jgi:hypothetical protein
MYARKSLETGQTAEQHICIVSSLVLYPTIRLQEEQEDFRFFPAPFASFRRQNAAHLELV